MNAVTLTSFGFGDQLVRVTDRDGDAWFVGNDVCKALELKNPRDAVARLDDDEKGVVTTDTLGGEQQTTIVSESGVYALIFTSRKPIAKEFRKWVTSEVLPTLRKTGHYAMPDDKAEMAPGLRVPKLGTASDRDAMRVAVLMIREMKDLYGQQAGRQMWVRLGFPLPDDLDPVPLRRGDAPMSMEGDINLWCMAKGVRESRRDATHQSEMYASYLGYCTAVSIKPMGAERFTRMIILLFGHEEHPEMIKATIARK